MAQSVVTGQWADSVLAVSSEYADEGSSASYSAEQALGEPDTFDYGQYSTAWSPSSTDGTDEFITLGFATPVNATGVVIREASGNGFVRKVELLGVDDVYREVWSGTDDSPTGSPWVNPQGMDIAGNPARLAPIV